MAITIHVNDNPLFNSIGSPTLDTVHIVTSVAATKYEIQRRDGQESFIVNVSDGTNEKVKSISSTELKIVLPMRQKYKVRVFTGTWSAFVNFKTRDKNYSSPSAITKLEIADDTDPTAKNNKTITVTNLAKQTVTNTSRGATVVNSKKVLNSVASIADTARGATIIMYSTDADDDDTSSDAVVIPVSAVDHGISGIVVTFSGPLQTNLSAPIGEWTVCLNGSQNDIISVSVSGSTATISSSLSFDSCGSDAVSYSGTTVKTSSGVSIPTFTNFSIT